MTDDYNDDDFDTYEDEFDEEPTMQVSQVQPVSALPQKSNIISKQEQKKRKDRIDWIKNNVKLCTESYELFDQTPMSQYDVFNRSIGKQNGLSSVASQYNSDWMSKEVQTDDVLMVEGSTSFQAEVSRSSLTKFLKKYSKVVETLVLESSPQDSNRLSGNIDSSLKSLFSSSILLDWKDSTALLNQKLVNLLASPASNSVYLTVYSDEKSTSLICIWNVSYSYCPLQVFSCDAVITSSCFSPERGHFVFAGLKEGSLLVWDTRDLSCETPVYSTDGINCHVGPIASLGTISGEDSSFQLISMDLSGKVCVWTIVELKGSDFADYCMAPNGKVKLVLASTFCISKNSFVNFMIIRPHNITEILACVGEKVFRKSRLNEFLLTDNYIPDNENYGDYPLLIEFHPVFDSLFLVAYQSGKICLYSIDCVAPLHVWKFGCSEIIAIKWCLFCPSQFIASDSKRLYLYDCLLKNMSSYIFPCTKLTLSCAENSRNEFYCAVYNQDEVVEIFCFRSSLKKFNAMDLESFKLKFVVS